MTQITARIFGGALQSRISGGVGGGEAPAPIRIDSRTMRIDNRRFTIDRDFRRVGSARLGGSARLRII